jgi:hypothetical protein
MVNLNFDEFSGQIPRTNFFNFGPAALCSSCYTIDMPPITTKKMSITDSDIVYIDIHATVDTF